MAAVQQLLQPPVWPWQQLVRPLVWLPGS